MGLDSVSLHVALIICTMNWWSGWPLGCTESVLQREHPSCTVFVSKHCYYYSSPGWRTPESYKIYGFLLQELQFWYLWRGELRDWWCSVEARGPTESLTNQSQKPSMSSPRSGSTKGSWDWSLWLQLQRPGNRLGAAGSEGSVEAGTEGKEAQE